MLTTPQALGMTKPILARFANLYVRFLFALEIILLFASLLVVHISLMVGVGYTYITVCKALIIGNLIAQCPIALFSKERNVWKNEFRSCPRWIRVLVILLAVYGIIAILLGAVQFFSEEMVGSGFFLGFNAIGLSVLYSVTWADPLEQPELIRRTRNSLIGIAIVVSICIADRAGFFPHHRPAEYKRIDLPN